MVASVEDWRVSLSTDFKANKMATSLTNLMAEIANRQVQSLLEPFHRKQMVEDLQCTNFWQSVG